MNRAEEKIYYLLESAELFTVQTVIDDLIDEGRVKSCPTRTEIQNMIHQIAYRNSISLTTLQDGRPGARKLMYYMGERSRFNDVR